MANALPAKPRRPITARGVLRVVLAVVLSFGLFAWWSNSVGRGFLPQQRRTIWLEARHDPSGEWSLAQLATGQQRDDDPPAPTSPDVLRFRVEESTMGRTDMGEWSSWRASMWTAFLVADSGGWKPWDERKDLHTAALDSALAKFVEQSVIPSSPALAIWPEAPQDHVTHDKAMWTVWQHRFSAATLVSIIFVCLALGTGASFLILPRPKTARADPGDAT